MPDDEPKLVFSTSGIPPKPEVKREAIEPQSVTAVMRIEKGGRGGKTVTVIDKLPAAEDFLKSLAAELKGKCGTGGTYSHDGQVGRVEIQGDKREQLRNLLVKKGFRVKG